MSLLPRDAAPPSTAPDAPPDAPPGLRFAVGGIALTLGIAALHFGQNLLAPLVLSALLAFALAPAVAVLRRWRLPHAPAVALVLAGALTVLAALGMVMGQQLVSLGRDLPRYQDTVREKLRELRPNANSGPMRDAFRLLGVVEGELDAARRALAPPVKPTAPPLRVQVEPAPTMPLTALAQVAVAALLPLAQFGLVVVLAFFMLLQRHEIRDRLLGLLGEDLARNADALSDAAERVSRYLVAQLLVNAAYAVPLGLGLWAIGVPAAWLWALMGGVLRFVPYLGPVVAGLGPLLLAFAVDPGWEMVVHTLLLIAVLELVVNNAIEPLAYGRSTGVSSLAVLLSAGFWSLVWGPVGLALATPLTVCMVVLGRHLGPLRFLDQLLSSKPVFDAPTRLHQRLLSGDVEAALEQAEEVSTPEGRLAFYDDAGVAVLRQTLLTPSAAHRHRVVSGMARLLEALRDPVDAAEGAAAPGLVVLCAGARVEADTLAAEMLAHAAQLNGLQARALPAGSLGPERIGDLPLDGVAAVCVVSFNPAPLTHLRFVLRRLRRRAPGLAVLLVALDDGVDMGALEGLEPLGGALAATSVKEAVARLRALPAPSHAATDAPSHAAPIPPVVDPSFKDALHRCAQRALDVFGVDIASVLLSDGQGMAHYASAGRPVWRTSDSPQALADSPLQQALVHHGGLYLPDLEREPDFGPTHPFRADGMRFYASAPAQDAAGTTLGVLALHSLAARTLDEGELALLARMATELTADVKAMHPMNPVQGPHQAEPPDPPPAAEPVHV